MREICLSGLTSGDRRRSHASPDCGGGAKASPVTHREANATAPVVDSTETNAAVVEEQGERGPPLQHVVDGFVQVVGTGKVIPLLLEIDAERLDDQLALILSYGASLLGTLAVDRPLDIKETIDLADHLKRNGRDDHGLVALRPAPCSLLEIRVDKERSPRVAPTAGLLDRAGFAVGRIELAIA
jgi:hypothetical protein